MIRFFAFLSSLFGPPHAVESAIVAAGPEPQCAAFASNVYTELARRGIRSRIDTADGHAFVRVDNWVIDNGKLCGPSRICLAKDALYGLKEPENANRNPRP